MEEAGRVPGKNRTQLALSNNQGPPRSCTKQKAFMDRKGQEKVSSNEWIVSDKVTFLWETEWPVRWTISQG